MRTIVGLSLALFLVTAFGTAQADVPQKVQKALKGKIVITSQPLTVTHDDRAKALAAIDKARVRAVDHTENDGVAQWSFYFTAFFKKAPRVNMVSLDFYTADKERLYVASKRMGIDPRLLVLSGSVSLTEDDGLAKNRTYQVRLTTQRRGRDVVLAKTTLTTQ